MRKSKLISKYSKFMLATLLALLLIALMGCTNEVKQENEVKSLTDKIESLNNEIKILNSEKES